jgi:hypothetical protein
MLSSIILELFAVSVPKKTINPIENFDIARGMLSRMFLGLTEKSLSFFIRKVNLNSKFIP